MAPDVPHSPHGNPNHPSPAEGKSLNGSTRSCTPLPPPPVHLLLKLQTAGCGESRRSLAGLQHSAVHEVLGKKKIYMHLLVYVDRYIVCYADKCMRR